MFDDHARDRFPGFFVVYDKRHVMYNPLTSHER